MSSITRFTLVGITALAASGCGKFFDNFDRLSTTTVKISTARSSGGRLMPFAQLGGGLMIWVNDTNGDHYSLSGGSESSDFSVTLPAGHTYSFVAYGWDTPGMSGIPRCGVVGATSVSGAAQSVPITLSQEGCTNDLIAAPAFRVDTGTAPNVTSTTAPLTLQMCALGTNVGQVTQTGTFGVGSFGCSMSDRFDFGTPGAQLGDGGFLAASNSIVFLVKNDSSDTDLHRFDFSDNTDETLGIVGAGQHLNSIQVAPPLPSESTKRVLFIANLTNSSVDDLYLYQPDISAPVNVSNIVIPTPVVATGTVSTASNTITGISTTGIHSGDLISGTGIGANTYAGVVTGGTVTMQDSSGTSLNGPSNGSLSLTFTAATPQVKEFHLSRDGKFAVFVANLGYEAFSGGAGARYTLYSVNISGITATNTTAPTVKQISANAASNSLGLANCNLVGPACGNNGQNIFTIRMSPTPSGTGAPTAPYVLYVSDEDSPGIFNIHVASLDKSDLFNNTTPITSGTNLTSSLSLTASDFPDSIRFTNSAKFAAFHLHRGPSTDEYWSFKFANTVIPALSPFCGAGAPGFSTCNAMRPYFAAAPTTDLIAFQTDDPGSPSLPRLHIRDMVSTTIRSNVITPGTATTDEVSFREYRFTSDETSLVSLSANQSNVPTVVRSGTVSGTLVNAVFNAIGPPVQVYPSKANGGQFLKLYAYTDPNTTITTNYVVFKMDQGFTGDPYIAYGNPGVNGFQRISGSFTTGKHVQAFALDGAGNAYFSGNFDTGNFDLYKAPIDTSDTRTAQDSVGEMGSIVNISDDAANENASQFDDDGHAGDTPTGKVFLEAAPVIGGNASSTEGFLYDPSVPSYTRMSVLNDAGRAKVSLLGTSGQILESQCLIPSSGGNSVLSQYLDDTGVLQPANIRIPMGDGVTNAPYGVRVDVFGGSDGCEGAPSDTFNFPNGLGVLSTATSGASKKLQSNASTNPTILRLLLDDPN